MDLGALVYYRTSNKCVSLFPILRIESGAETSVYGIKSSLHNLQNIFSSSQIFLFPSFLDILDPPRLDIN